MNHLIESLISFLLLVTLLVAGCARIEKSPPHLPILIGGECKGCVGKGSTYHVLGVLLTYGVEQRECTGYGVYTYVLFNCNQSDATTPEGKRYVSILRAMLHDVKPIEIGLAAGWPKNETNIFLIPAVTRNLTSTDALEKYDFELSQQYLAVLQGSVRTNKELFNRLERRPGPFLVSLCEPLPRLQGKSATKMLYLDLSDMPADGMRQVLDAYKQRLDAEPIRNVERLKESLKIVLMKYALLLDENLKIVDVAFARFK